MHKLLLPVALLVFLLPSCALFEAENVDPVVQGIAGMEAKMNETQQGARALITYGEANGMPPATVRTYQDFFNIKQREFDKLLLGVQAAMAELGSVTMTEILNATEQAAQIYAQSRGPKAPAPASSTGPGTGQ